MKEVPIRNRDVRILVTKTVGGEYNSYWRIANKGDILDGRLDVSGDFHFEKRGSEMTIFPTHFKILGKFYFRKSKK